MINTKYYGVKNIVSESMDYIEEITFPPVTRVSNVPVIIEAAIFGIKKPRMQIGLMRVVSSMAFNNVKTATNEGKDNLVITSLAKENKVRVKSCNTGTHNTNLYDATVGEKNAHVSTLNSQNNIVKVSSLTNEENVLGADVALPIAAMDETCDKFANTLYGYFIGSWLVFPIVQITSEGMLKVLNGGPWFIRSRPIMLNIWSANTKLKMEDCTKVPVWIKIHNVPVVAFSEIGLSLITTQLGRPIMLDARTSDLCLNPWSQSTCARALIELSAESAIKDSVVVAIPFPNGSDHSLETLDVEYEWRPYRCSKCKIFDHDDELCPTRTKKDFPVSAAWNGGVSNVGSKANMQTKHGFGGNQPTIVKQVHWIRFSKPKVMYRPVSKVHQVDAKEITPSAKEMPRWLTNHADPLRLLRMLSLVIMDALPCDNGKSTFIQDDIDLGQLKANMDRLMEEDKEVCMPNVVPGGGFLDDMEYDLDYYDGYEAQVYDLSNMRLV
nr:hypothetical protein [Tanacetum cinerariifolium]